MGNVSADGKWLWLSGRYDNVVYAFDTSNGAVKVIPVGKEPHGLTVWPQPGRYSLGHTETCGKRGQIVGSGFARPHDSSPISQREQLRADSSASCSVHTLAFRFHRLVRAVTDDAL
jgi:hypothetical protein